MLFYEHSGKKIVSLFTGLSARSVYTPLRGKVCQELKLLHVLHHSGVTSRDDIITYRLRVGAINFLQGRPVRFSGMVQSQ
jgi:hypothetical protein